MLFGLGDVGFFRKKVDGSNNESRDFRYTKGNCKTYGSRVVDTFAFFAGICFIVPLAIDIFNRDSGNGGKHNGKTRKR